jgi:hypothetical protein
LVVVRNLGGLVRRSRAQGEAESAKTLKRSGATEVFFRSDGLDTGPLVVVYHIQKTAGTALRHLVRANLPPVETEIMPGMQSLRHSPDRLLSWYQDWYHGLDPDRKARLCCVMSHLSGYLLPALDRPAEALVLVREPVDRTVSYYHVKQRRRKPDRLYAALEEIYATPPSERPDSAKRERWEQFYNWQSRCLLSIFHDVSELPTAAGPSRDADLWRARLHELVDGIFFVGVQDRFAGYVGSLARRFGWTAFVRHSKVNPQRPPVSEISEDLRDTIRAYNWLDAELYELCRQAQDRREAEEACSS